jgi:hypothetical protein
MDDVARTLRTQPAWEAADPDGVVTDGQLQAFSQGMRRHQPF